MAFSVFGTTLTVILINRLGKRFLSLSTMAACSVCYASIGIIGYFWAPSPVSSWIRLALFFMASFFSSMGIVPVMWILYGELYPMK